MSGTFNTAVTVRNLEATGLKREQAEAIATACHEAVDAAQPVTRPELDAALAALENRLTMRMFGSVFAAAGLLFAALKLTG
ncbi:MAG: hypothetical protein OXF56_25970 [Rhodobacteraceae bacterium]|nr:hypothetical protein [Paracoccaceae bacterium]